MRSKSPNGWLAWLGAVLVRLTSFDLLLDVPMSAGATHILRGRVRIPLFMMSSAVYFDAVWLVQRLSWTCDTAWIVLGVFVTLRADADRTRRSAHQNLPLRPGRSRAGRWHEPDGYIPPRPALRSVQNRVVHSRSDRVSNVCTICPPVAQFVFATGTRIRLLPLYVRTLLRLLVELRQQPVTNLQLTADIGDSTCPLRLP